MAKIISATKLSGVIETFEGKGRGFGYPTANISANTKLEDGVYFGFANLGVYKHHPTLIFVGTPTTVGATTNRVEAHLLDIADNDYYGKQLELEICHFHRPNQHFGTMKELVSAMKADELAGRSWFRAINAQLSAEVVGTR